MKESFDLGIDLEMNLSEIYGTKAEVNYDSLPGTFSVPDRNNLSGKDSKFAFAIRKVVIESPFTGFKGLTKRTTMCGGFMGEEQRWVVPGSPEIQGKSRLVFAVSDCPINSIVIQTGGTEAMRVNKIEVYGVFCASM